jgi:Rrf2 family nitric oxide-sensitive transcriptional repressor
MHLAARPHQLASISEIAKAYGISHNHLMKVVHDLRRAGYVASVRGRSGGMRLARAAAEINIGEVVRHTEEGFDLADCRSCIIAPACALTSVLNEALDGFMAVLDRHSLADLVINRADALRELFRPTGSAALDTSARSAASPHDAA